MPFLLVVYAIGVAAGLGLTDGAWGMRVPLALLWPIGPLAFVVTLAILLAASLIAFPLFGLLAAAGAAGLWWLFV